MKKKVISIILAALMIVPFGMISVSADTAVPDEPKVTTTNKWYIGFGGSGDGSSADNYKTTDVGKGNVWGDITDGTAEEGNGEIYDLVKAGGTVYIVKKGHIGTDAVFKATDTPVCFTGEGYLSTTEDGSADVSKQLGMLLSDGHKMTFEGDVILENTALLCRNSTPDTYSVAGTGKLVVKDSVQIVHRDEGQSNAILNVEEGGYAYLHAVGFSAYTGKGTLVIDEALKSEVESFLTNYEGTVVYAKAEADTTDSSATTDSAATDSTTTAGATTTAPTTTVPTDNPSTGDMTVVFAVLAALSVAACASVVIVKKAKEN